MQVIHEENKDGLGSVDNHGKRHESGSSPDDDFDNDGLSNAIEFVLGGLATTKGLGKLPAIATTGGNMTFTYVRDRDSVDPGVSVRIEVGTNLSTWLDIFTAGAKTGASTPGVTVTDNLDGTDTITLTLPQAPHAGRFARLKVAITE